MEKLLLSSHYGYKNILRQSLAPIIMMIFVSLYSVIDGIFIANFVGNDAFAGVNLIYPLIMIVGGLGFMFGSGGSALASKLLGEKNRDEANRVFTMMIEAAFLLDLVISIILFFFVDEIARGLASISSTSTQEMIDAAILYGRILILGQPLFAVQNLFQNFFVVDERPALGFLETLLAGLTNIALDALFIIVFKWGVMGAAIATIIGYFVGSLFSILWFTIKKNDLLRIKLCKFDAKILVKTMTNGISDFIFNISSSIVSIIFNVQLLKYIGQDGISAYGVIMYISFIFIAIFVGFAIGMGPVIGYNYGAQNKKELHDVVKRLIVIYTIVSAVMTILCEALADPLAHLFVDKPDLVELTINSLRIYSLSYPFAGYCILIVMVFTSLNNGLISGVLSLLRSLVINIIFVFIFPLFMGSYGIFWSIVFTEALSAVICFWQLIRTRERYIGKY